MAYRVKELFLTIQGEGVNTGRRAVFCRFAGCNLWSGRAEHRSTAVCRFCDTDFVGTDGPGGGRYTAPELADAVVRCWDDPTGGSRPFVVCTGGEPLLQLDGELVGELAQRGVEIAVETNGTIEVPPGVDWVCVSPKGGAPLVVRSGDELKLVHPQDGAPPERYADLDFDHFLLQPMDGPDRAANTELAIRYCLEHPGWRLSTQTHKVLGIP